MNLKKLVFKEEYRIYWIILLIIILTGSYLLLKNKNAPETLVVHPEEFLQQISVSGKIVAGQSIDLSFEQTGQVKKIYVKEGDSVKAGQLLLAQDASQLYAQLALARAGIEFQQAKLNQLLAGSSPEDIKISENSVVLAQQDLNNAYDNALTVLDSSYFAIYNANAAAFLLQSSYFSQSDQQGIKVFENTYAIEQSLKKAKFYLDNAKDNFDDANINLAISNMIESLDDTYQALSVIRDQCDIGIYYLKIVSGDKASIDTQKTKINTALDDTKSSQQDILNYKVALQQAQNKLNLVNAPARSSDIAVYQAQVNQAMAEEKNILIQLKKRQIYSPIEGVVSNINAKLGSVFLTNETATSVISSDPFQIESYVPEIYVSLLEVGDLAEVTLDAYYSQIKFESKVVSISSAETIKDGVPTYKTKLQFINGDNRLKPGMSANVVIATEKKENIISLPQGIIINKNGKNFVKVKEEKNITEKEVQIGSVSSSGKIEIISGLKDGDMVMK